ncbi:tRNA 2-selenouridine(34) synthase MnmH [Octadecabacter sp. 1_MG-2023]|uniref:tRNA 2-selenouridine(34) synthase MnmH n=1 Tax=unclassified Octadecabacter TaxID=196158 RepID=UPI001C09F4DE|nr:MULTISPECIES: tRNA 2-selenouridine(34) synthase MnmH [unclassified Octadecabacter]MBU2992443.1 tRNA 2-selenouridine(34) synthase MnmH [Octadecabacter sp. B2R22]MDO6734800.1 tRNA 2-selenouridine(34) synthase MnmH [Octadecabacter sp. 1_MG-2023]
MKTSFATLSDMLNHGFDTVIDVRSPAEFAEDHVPGAINLPALSNDQRAEIGTIFVQDTPFNARKLGAAMVARNVADHLIGPLAEKDGGWCPLVYCWRGGQRSGSFASILTQIGWRAGVVEGGYQTFRRLVYDALYTDELTHRIILLDGNTGTAKTEILRLLGAGGVQALDLEGLANHRGSLLGAMEGGQPSQKAFETALASALAGFDPSRPVIIEAESSKIGARIIPPALWTAMKAAPRIEIDAPLDARARYLAKAYADMSANRETMISKLEILRRHRGGLVDGWRALLDGGDLEGLARALMEDHYDPSYRASRARHGAQVLERFTVTDLGEAGREVLACQIAEAIAAS